MPKFQNAVAYGALITMILIIPAIHVLARAHALPGGEYQDDCGNQKNPGQK